MVVNKIIVAIVHIEKTIATASAGIKPPSAAGYIRSGISGSQGPRTSNTNNGQNERDRALFSA